MHSMKINYDMTFKIMILGSQFIRCSVWIKTNYSSNKKHECKLGTYTLEKQKVRKQTCSKQQKTQLYTQSHCIPSTKLAA